MTSTIPLGFPCPHCSAIIVIDREWAAAHATAGALLRCPRGHEYGMGQPDDWPAVIAATRDVNWLAVVGGIAGALMLWAAVLAAGRLLWTLLAPLS